MPRRHQPDPPEIAGLRLWLAGIRLQRLLRKANFNPGQLRDEVGRWTTEGGSGRAEPASRRRTGRSEGTPAQQARLAAAEARAREATRRLRELEPTWQAPQSFVDPDNLEGRISHQEATTQAAEARLAEILRNAIPGTNPSWGINRLRKELYDQGYVFLKPTRDPGFFYRNYDTGEDVRIMERPTREPFRKESLQKFHNDFYYRYKPADGSWGTHITIPDK